MQIGPHSRGHRELTTPAPEDWRDWIPEAHRVIEEWEADTRIRMLLTQDILSLAERIARALHNAYERGRST
jgi:hypothetical protein